MLDSYCSIVSFFASEQLWLVLSHILLIDLSLSPLGSLNLPLTLFLMVFPRDQSLAPFSLFTCCLQWSSFTVTVMLLILRFMLAPKLPPSCHSLSHYHVFVNFLKLNPSKIEVLLISPKSTVSHINNFSLDLNGVTMNPTVRPMQKLHLYWNS